MLPSDQQLPFVNRKGIVTQNVMVVCSFDMGFTFIYAGWEGSANSLRILWEALRNKNLKFPHTHEDEYYIIDGGYANMPDILSPFQVTRYHLQDYRYGVRASNAKELFSHAHFSLRNVLEHNFGVLKARF